ncbi:MAG: hypothetical protein VX185_03715 [Pseudomonadota bacterium]|nr:hypothetical protein [Pseudomonadota bacterium]
MSRVLTFTNVETGDISKPFTELGGKIGFGSRCELTIPLAMTTDDFYFVLADVFVYGNEFQLKCHTSENIVLNTTKVLRTGDVVTLNHGDLINCNQYQFQVEIAAQPKPKPMQEAPIHLDWYKKGPINKSAVEEQVERVTYDEPSAGIKAFLEGLGSDVDPKQLTPQHMKQMGESFKTMMTHIWQQQQWLEDAMQSSSVNRDMDKTMISMSHQSVENECKTLLNHILSQKAQKSMSETVQKKCQNIMHDMSFLYYTEEKAIEHMLVSFSPSVLEEEYQHLKPVEKPWFSFRSLNVSFLDFYKQSWERRYERCFEEIKEQFEHEKSLHRLPE